jgi:hypothetical protein
MPLVSLLEAQVAKMPQALELMDPEVSQAISAFLSKVAVSVWGWWERERDGAKEFRSRARHGNRCSTQYALATTGCCQLGLPTAPTMIAPPPDANACHGVRRPCQGDATAGALGYLFTMGCRLGIRPAAATAAAAAAAAACSPQRGDRRHNTRDDRYTARMGQDLRGCSTVRQTHQSCCCSGWGCCCAGPQP